MNWRLYICAHCDSDEGVLIHSVPEGAHRDRACNFDTCPACGGYLSMIDMGGVTVSGSSLVHLQLRNAEEA